MLHFIVIYGLCDSSSLFSQRRDIPRDVGEVRRIIKNRNSIIHRSEFRCFRVLLLYCFPMEFERWKLPDPAAVRHLIKKRVDLFNRQLCRGPPPRFPRRPPRRFQRFAPASRICVENHKPSISFCETIISIPGISVYVDFASKLSVLSFTV